MCSDAKRTSQQAKRSVVDFGEYPCSDIADAFVRAGDYDELRLVHLDVLSRAGSDGDV